MTTGLKVWLWFVLVVNAISGVTMIATALIVPVVWVSVLLEALIVAGTAMLLFAQKKMGFYLIIGAAVLGVIINLVLGGNLIMALVSAIVMPMITWLLLKNVWYDFK